MAGVARGQPRVPMVPGQGLGQPSSELWGFGDVGLQEVWDEAQLRVSGDLRVQKVKNDY